MSSIPLTGKDNNPENGTSNTHSDAKITGPNQVGHAKTLSMGNERVSLFRITRVERLVGKETM